MYLHSRRRADPRVRIPARVPAISTFLSCLMLGDMTEVRINDYALDVANRDARSAQSACVLPGIIARWVAGLHALHKRTRNTSVRGVVQHVRSLLHRL